MPMLATQANGQPAYGLYMRTPAGDFVPFQLQVLELDGDRVRHVTAFFDLAPVRDVRAARPPARRPRARAGRSVTTTLGGSVELLDRALAYTCAPAVRASEDDLLGRRTPCAAWTLADLLAHMEDALDAFTEAAGGAVAVHRLRPRRRPGRGDPGQGVRPARRLEPPGPGRRRPRGVGRPARPRSPAAGHHRRARGHRARLGRRPGDRAGRPDPGRAGRGAAPGRATWLVLPSDRGRAVRRTPAGARRCAVRPTPAGVPRSDLTGPPARSQAFRSPGVPGTS